MKFTIMCKSCGCDQCQIGYGWNDLTGSEFTVIECPECGQKEKY